MRKEVKNPKFGNVAKFFLDESIDTSKHVVAATNRMYILL